MKINDTDKIKEEENTKKYHSPINRQCWTSQAKRDVLFLEPQIQQRCIYLYIDRYTADGMQLKGFAVSKEGTMRMSKDRWLQKLYETNYARLYKLAAYRLKTYTGSEADVMDVLQDVFFLAVEK